MHIHVSSRYYEKLSFWTHTGKSGVPFTNNERDSHNTRDLSSGSGRSVPLGIVQARREVVGSPGGKIRDPLPWWTRNKFLGQGRT